jgi:hypothetical protein
MLALNIILGGDSAWPDLLDQRENIINVTTPIGITALAGGMTSGKASVALRIDLPDGRVVIAETSLALFLTAAKVFEAKYGTLP